MTQTSWGIYFPIARHFYQFRLIEILKDLAESDWILAGMVCQILWNYSEKITRAVDVFGVHETDDLLTVLNELLGNNFILDF